MTPRNALKAVLLLAVVAALMFPAAALAGEKADQQAAEKPLVHRDHINKLAREPLKIDESPKPTAGLARKIDWSKTSRVAQEKRAATLGRTMAIGPLTPEQRSRLN